jgi:hypothetical protein
MIYFKAYEDGLELWIRKCLSGEGNAGTRPERLGRSGLNRRPKAARQTRRFTIRNRPKLSDFEVHLTLRLRNQLVRHPEVLCP